jgi:hypothetical protein
MVLNIILTVIGLLMLIESVIALFFPKWIIKIGKSLLKNAKTVKKIAWIELIVAIFLIILGMNM